MTRMLSVAALAVTAVTLTVTPALAAPRGGGASGGSTGWVSASPNPASAWGARVGITGCGFSSALAQLVITHPAGTTTGYVPMWSDGCLDSGYFLTSEPGTYTISIYQPSST